MTRPRRGWPRRGRPSSDTAEAWCRPAAAGARSPCSRGPGPPLRRSRSAEPRRDTGRGRVLDRAETELFVDDTVHLGAVVRVRHEYVDPVLAHALGVEPVLHREPGGEEPDLAQTVVCQRRGRGIDQVHERDLDRGLDRSRDLVHGVGRQRNRARAPALTSPWAASARMLPASSHRPATCICSIGAKSTECSTIGAECSPPRRVAAPSLSSW